MASGTQFLSLFLITCLFRCVPTTSSSSSGGTFRYLPYGACPRHPHGGCSCSLYSHPAHPAHPTHPHQQHTMDFVSRPSPADPADIMHTGELGTTLCNITKHGYRVSVGSKFDLKIQLCSGRIFNHSVKQRVVLRSCVIFSGLLINRVWSVLIAPTSHDQRQDVAFFVCSRKLSFGTHNSPPLRATLYCKQRLLYHYFIRSRMYLVIMFELTPRHAPSRSSHHWF